MTAPGWHRKRTDTPAVQARKRKYDSAEHRAARARFKVLVDYGLARCWRPTCGKILIPGHWHVGHDDHQIDLIRGPECASCNRKAGASKGARIANAKRKATAVVRPFVRPVR